MKRSAHCRHSFCCGRALASLKVRAAVLSRHTFEQGAFERIVRKGRLDGGPRETLQLTLSKAEALTRHGVFAADASAEVGRIVRAQCELHTGFVQGAERVGAEAFEDLRGDVRRGARLEDYPSVGDLLDQCRVF